MSKRIRKILLSFSCMILFFGVSVIAANNSNASSEVYKPFAEISDLTVNKKNFKQGDTLEYSLKIKDLDSTRISSFSYGGIYTVRVTWKSEKGQKLNRYFLWNQSESEISYAYDYGTVGTWRVIKDKIKIRKGMQAGKWTVSEITLTDDWDGMDDIDTEQAFYIYPGSGVVEKTRMYANLSAFDISVSGTKKDNTPPEINKKSLWLKYRTTSGEKKNVFRVKVKDSSPIRYVTCQWHYIVPEGKKKNRYRSGEKRMTYNKKKKAWECYVGADESKGAVTRLYTVTVCDIFGNRATYIDSSRKEAKGVKKKYRCDFSNMKIYTK